MATPDRIAGDRVTKQYGGGDGTSEGGEIRRDVVDRGNESLVHELGDSYEDTTREGHGQEEAHHGRSLAEAPPDQPPTTVARACKCRMRAAGTGHIPPLWQTATSQLSFKAFY